MKLLRYFLLPAYRPAGGIKALLTDRRRVLYAVLIFLFLGAIYTVSVQLAYMRGIGAAVEPFLKIPAIDYYYWQRFFQIPFFFVTSIVFAGTVRLVSMCLGGKGSFEDIFSVFCVAQTFPMFLTMWIPETVGFVFFPGQSIFPVWIDVARQITGILWPLAVMVMGISTAERIKWYYSAIITLIAAVPLTTLMIVFIR